MSFEPFTISTLQKAYRSGRTTPFAVAGEALRRIAAYADPAVWIARVPDDAVFARARALVEHPNPESLPLFGVPFAVKDNIDCAGLPTTAGCPDFAYEPERSAPVVEHLLAAGAMLMGKTNLDQFATGLTGTRSPYGAPRCVFDPRYISGGSSSGSAVAVAAGLVAFALGTDTAGSGRVPAAFNNIIGMKPSRGLVSTRGVVPACRTLDCLSIFAQTLGDADDILRVAARFDPLDAYARPVCAKDLPQEDFRFGILPREEWAFLADGEDAALYEAAVARLRALGGQEVTIDFDPFREAGALLYEGSWTAERLSSIGAFMREHEGAMDPNVSHIIAGARQRSAVDAFEGFYRLKALARSAEAEWARMDLLLLPTVPGQPMVGEIEADPLAVNARLGRYTNFVNLLDCCAVAVPAGFRRNGLAFGVTMIAPAHADRSLATIADRFHRAGAFGMGAARSAVLPPPALVVAPAGIEIFVVGAHLSGMPLNGQLRHAGGVFRREARTSPDYRFFVLPATDPPKPGLVRTPRSEGPGIAGEIWTLPADAFGRFVSEIPAPLGIGKVTLDDGSSVSGFLCEAHAVAGAVEITRLGGWRAYRESLAPVS